MGESKLTPGFEDIEAASQRAAVETTLAMAREDIAGVSEDVVAHLDPNRNAKQCYAYGYRVAMRRVEEILEAIEADNVLKRMRGE